MRGPRLEPGDNLTDTLRVLACQGPPLSESNSDKVFAYEKKVPASGGYVLMGDGKTIKKMTAEDFQQALKLAELPKTPKP